MSACCEPCSAQFFEPRRSIRASHGLRRVEAGMRKAWRMGLALRFVCRCRGSFVATRPGRRRQPPPNEARGPRRMESARHTPPIVFFVAKGEADACGPGCAEWIAADGTIDAGAPARLRALLAKTGKRKLPIYLPLARRLGRRRDRNRADHARTRHDRGRRPHDSARLRHKETTARTACDSLKRSGRDAHLRAAHRARAVQLVMRLCAVRRDRSAR